MDRCISHIYVSLVWIVVLCLNTLDLCSCKSIKHFATNIQLVPCVVELIVPREPESEDKQVPGSLSKLKELLTERIPWSRKDKGVEETEYSLAALCIYEDPPNTVNDVQTNHGKVNAVQEGLPQSGGHIQYTKKRIFKRGTSHSGRGSVGRRQHNAQPNDSSWLWKRRRNDSKKR